VIGVGCSTYLASIDKFTSVEVLAAFGIFAGLFGYQKYLEHKTNGATTPKE
jgi:hypothetical protein